jgi:aspartate/methionine/tyrosine aminotransferase
MTHDNDSDNLETQWKGRFPENEIISLLQVNRRLNLAESTSQDFHFGELLDLIGPEHVRHIRLGYSCAQGAEILRDEVAMMCDVKSEEVICTEGTAMALYLLAVELCRPGDEAVIFTPCFPPSRDSLIGSGITVNEIPLGFENGYQVQLTKFKESLSSKTKLVSLATPQNPSGMTADKAVVLEMLDIMATVSPEAFLFIDETYANATYGDSRPEPSFAPLHPMIISGSSVSKAYGAPGLRVGWMTVPDADLRLRLMTAKMNMVISGSPLNEALAALILRNRDTILATRGAMLSEALELVTDWQAHNASQVDWVRPDCGALCCFRLRPEAFDDEQVELFWQRLPELDLQLASGEWFGESNRVFRLGFGYLPIKTLEEALHALRSALQTNGT